MVESNCASFDGTAYAVGNNDALHDGAKVTLDMLFKTKALDSNYTILAGKTKDGDFELSLFLKDSDIVCYLSDSSNNFTEYKISSLLEANTIYKYKIMLNTNIGNVQLILVKLDTTNNNVIEIEIYNNTSTTTQANINNADTNFMIAYREHGGTKATFDLYYIEYGYANYNCAEGNGSVLYNSGTAGGDATLNNATLSTFWGSTQDVYHYNFLSGFNSYYLVPVSYAPSTEVEHWSIGTAHFSINDAQAVIMFMSAQTYLYDGYSLWFGKDIIVFRKFLDGAFTALATVTGLDLEGRRTIDITRSVAGIFSITLDGTEIITVTDTDITTSAYVVYRSYDGDILLDYFRDSNDIDYDLPKLYLPNQDGVDPLGYTILNPAGKWHNGAETKIQLPATLKAVVDGDCPNPLSYSEFQTNFNNANMAFSNMHEKQHKQLVFYNRALTVAEIKKLQKCLDVKNSEYALIDENGNILTDENGLILVGE